MADDKEKENKNESGAEDAEPRPFSEKQLTAMAAKLTEIVGDRPCEMCGNDQFGINPAPASPMMLGFQGTPPKMTVHLGLSHPAVMVHCNKCGNTKLFSLRILGFDPEKVPEE